MVSVVCDKSHITNYLIMYLRVIHFVRIHPNETNFTLTPQDFKVQEYWGKGVLRTPRGFLGNLKESYIKLLLTIPSSCSLDS